MADAQTTPSSPFTRQLAPGRHGRRDGPAGVTAHEITGASLVSITVQRGQVPALVAKARELLGLELPMAPRRVGNGRIEITWAGPGRWTVMRAEGTVGQLASELGSGLAGLATVVDLSHAQAVLRVSGPKIREVLAKGFAIDLHPRVFEAGQTAMTTVSHIAVQITRTAPEAAFEIAVPRSLAESLWHWLDASAAEFGLDVPASR